jgi:hypothetical protein
VLALGGWDGVGTLNRACLTSRLGWQYPGLFELGEGREAGDRLFSAQTGSHELATAIPNQRAFGLWRED